MLIHQSPHAATKVALHHHEIARAATKVAHAHHEIAHAHHGIAHAVIKIAHATTKVARTHNKIARHTPRAKNKKADTRFALKQITYQLYDHILLIYMNHL